MSAMSEDDLLVAVTDALTLGRWLWTHHRRSDLALTMGTPGIPDIVAVHPARGILVLELKSERGRYRLGQEAWLGAFRSAGADARVVRPSDLDALIDELVGDRLVKRRRRA